MAVITDVWSRWLAEGRYRGADHGERRRMQRRLQRVRDRILANAGLSPGAVVLDAGCGDGLLAAGAAAIVGTSGHVTGLDISSAALADAARLHPRITTNAPISWQLGDVTKLPFPDETFDVVIERAILMYVAQKRTAVAEYRRVLRRGGHVSLFEPINGQAAHIWRIDLNPVLALHKQVQAVELDLLATRCQPMLDYTADSLRGMFADAFSSVHTTVGVSRWIPASGRDWLSFIEQQPNPLWPSRRELIETALGADSSRYIEFIRARMKRGAFEFRCPTLYLVASV